jgi:hypothetical protein
LNRIAFFLAVGLCTGLLGPATGVSSFSFSDSDTGAAAGTGGRTFVAFRWDEVDGTCCVRGKVDAGWKPGTGGRAADSLMAVGNSDDIAADDFS